MAGLPWFKQQVDLRRDPRSLILGDILGDPRAWTYVVEMRMHLAEHAPTGCVSGAHAAIAFERGAGWTGERGALLSALREAGFVRAAPARDGGGMEIEDLDWVREQGAHVTKFQRDAKKPDGRAHKVVNPSRDIEGSRAAPAALPSGESRELRVEISSSASQEPEPVPEPPKAFALEEQKPPSKRGRKARPPTLPEQLFETLQGMRKERCEAAGEPFVPERWDFARRNEQLRPVVKASAEEISRFEGAWLAYLADDGERVREPAWSLAYFMSASVRAKYETRAVREETAA